MSLLVALLAAAQTLTVPFLPQTEALCGGAATAMVFRYWGDRHANVQQFASLVDTRAGGIADSVLIDAIRQRGWNAERLEGSIATIRVEVAAGRPLILMIEDRPSRYHYVVAVGSDDEHVIVHDPTWGPDRRIDAADFVRKWKATGFWTLLVTAGDGMREATPVALPSPRAPGRDVTACDRLLDEALDIIEANGSGVADEALEAVGRQCPTASAPFSELAGVRFGQQRWHDAATLAQRALALNAGDAYAWDVLGSSRYILDDREGALRAWNHIGKPQVDSVQIVGLQRARYAFMTELTGLAPNTLLTARQLALADRRLRELPDRVTTDIGYRPDTDGFATVNVDIVERSRGPHGIVDWSSFAAQAAIDREVGVSIPGTTGQGEIWDGSWRWWDGRPRLAVGFAAPRAGRFGGIWRVDASWEAQSYRAAAVASGPDPIRQAQTHGAISFSNWVTPNFRFEASAGLDVWDDQGELMPGAGSARTQRTVFAGGSVEQRFVADRVAITGAVTSWSPAGGGLSSFRAASVRALARSAADPHRFAVLADVRADFVSTAAPLALWSGAGDGRARPGLLRAHPLLDGGVIDGPVFGRHVQSATIELQRWLTQPQIPRVGIAVFADAAHATGRLDVAAGQPFQLDFGSGIRVRVPGSDRTFRIDYAHGLRDRRAHAITVGIVTGTLSGIPGSSPTR